MKAKPVFVDATQLANAYILNTSPFLWDGRWADHFLPELHAFQGKQTLQLDYLAGLPLLDLFPELRT